MNAADDIIRLNSKRNKVWLYVKDEEKLIKKDFKDSESYLNEKRIYAKLNCQTEKLCPQLLDYDDKDKILKIEYIDGVTILDKLGQYEKENNLDCAYRLMVELFGWLKHFHLVFGNRIIMDDVNLRNFILNEEKIYGIDFECSRDGLVIDDYFYAISMYSQYNPRDSKFKKNIIDKLYQNFFIHRCSSYEDFFSIFKERCTIIEQRRMIKNKFV